MKISKNTDVILQISIITYNRPDQIIFTLDSLMRSILRLDLHERRKIGVSIFNNSTRGYQLYKKIFEEYEVKFKLSGCSYFEHKLTGFNILFHNNFAISVLDSKAEYTWVCPDDDLLSLDSLKVLLSTIETYRPSFIHGGILNKTRYDYSKVSVDDSVVENKVHDVVNTNKERLFLDTSGIQLQEHVYRTELICSSLENDEVIGCLDEFSPTLFGLICIKSKLPMVFLKESIGIFRTGEPNSEWRYLWPYMSLIKWPNMVDNYLTAGVIEQKNVEFAKRIYIRELTENAWRPDVLLGFNSKFTINPVNLFQEYGMEYLLMLLRSPFLFIKKISTDKHCRNRFINKLVR